MVAGTDLVETLGGHPSYVRAHARAAAALGFVPHLFCVSPEEGLIETDFGMVHRVRSPWRLRAKNRVLGFRHYQIFLHAPLLAGRLARFVAAEPAVPLIHSFGVWGCAAVAAARCLARAGIRVATVVNAYTTLEHEFQARLRGTTSDHGRVWRLRATVDLAAIRAIVEPYERRAYTRSDRILVNYESVRRLLTAKWGSRLAVSRVPYAPETAFLAESAPASITSMPDLPAGDAPLVVAVSRQDPRKGVDILIRALGRLRAAGVPFRAVLIGGGKLLEVHRALARRVGLGRETVLPGFVPSPEPYLAAATVVALPSLQEASGSVSLLETLQAGVAVVASAIDGIPEDVRDEESALLVPPGDPDALAGAIRRLLIDVQLRRRVAAAGHAVFKQRFSAEALTAGLREVYQRMGVTVPERDGA
jgi:glycosyltransferase involved in cell wall biosynthesis